MTDPTTRPTYTLTFGGRDWVFKPDAVEALAAAGQSPLLVAIALGATGLQEGLTEVNFLKTVDLLITRHGRRIIVKAAQKPAQVADAGESASQEAQGRVQGPVVDSGAKKSTKSAPVNAQSPRQELQGDATEDRSGLF